MPAYTKAKNISFSRKKTGLLALSVMLLLMIISVRAEVNILDVRTGLHPDKTRVVLELDKIAFYRISYLDNPNSTGSREIIIDLRETPARDNIRALTGNAGGIGLLDRITVEDNGGSVRLRIFLRKAAAVDKSFTLKPDHGYAYRLVFDLKKVSAAEWMRLVKLTAPPEPAMRFPERGPPEQISPASEQEPDIPPDEPGDRESYDDMVTGDDNFTLSGYVEVEVRGFTQSALNPGQEDWTTSFALEPLLEYVSDSSNSQFSFRPFGRIDVHDSRRSHFDIRELKWVGTRDRWQVTVGIDTIFWGVTESSHLVDIINQDDSLEDIDREDKLGQPLASLSYDSDFGVFSAYVMPYFRQQRFPGIKGRLRLPLLVDTSQTLYEAGTGKRHVDLAVRWSHVIGNIDLGLYQFRGTNRQPQLIIGKDSQGNAVFIPRYSLINQTGLDLQGTFEDLLIKFEAIRRTGSDQIPGAQPPGAQDLVAQNLATQNFWAMTGGFEYTFYGIAGGDSDIGLLAEYLYDNRGGQATTPFEDDLFMGVRWAKNDIDSTEVLFGAVIDLHTSAKFVNFESSRRIGDNWKVTLDARFFLGVPVTGFLFPLSRDDFFQVRLARYF